MLQLVSLCLMACLCSGVPLPPRSTHKNSHQRNTPLLRRIHLPKQSLQSNLGNIAQEIARIQHLDKVVKDVTKSRVVRSVDTSDSPDMNTSESPDMNTSESPDMNTSASQTSLVYAMPDIDFSESKVSERSSMPGMEVTASERSQLYEMPDNSQYTSYEESQQIPDWEDTLIAPGYSDHSSTARSDHISEYSDSRSSSDHSSGYGQTRLRPDQSSEYSEYSGNRQGEYSENRQGEYRQSNYMDNRHGQYSSNMVDDNRSGQEDKRKDSRYKRKDNGKWNGHDNKQPAERRQDGAPEPLGPPGPYRYGYAVKDDDGNDFNQQEESNGNEVRGQYSVVLPDCRVLTVSYSVTPESGYVADVVYTPIDNCFSETGVAPGPVSAGSNSPEPTFVEAALPTYGAGYRQ